MIFRATNKIFDERSKQFSQEILKYQGKYKEDSEEFNDRQQHRDLVQSRTAVTSPVGHSKKQRVKSELKVSPINLGCKLNDKGFNSQLPDSIKSKDLAQIQPENDKMITMDITKERDKLQSKY